MRLIYIAFCTILFFVIPFSGKTQASVDQSQVPLTGNVQAWSSGPGNGIPFLYRTGTAIDMQKPVDLYQKAGNYFPISHYEADRLVDFPAFREITVPVHHRYASLADDSLLVYGMVTFHRLFSAVDGQELPYPTQPFTIDTISIGLGHENHSGNDDTIRLQLLALDTNGYPTNTILWDSIYTGVQLGMVNDWQTPGHVKFYCGAVLDTQQRVALKIQYFGALSDTLGLVYGYREGGTCALGGVNNAAFSVSYPNSLAYWTGYNLQLPTAAGGDLYRDCNGNFQFDTITDGANFIQNWNVTLIASAPDLGTSPYATSKVNVFPNPAHGFFYCSGETGKTIRIADGTGRIVKEVLNTGNAVDISDLETGMYYLIIEHVQNMLTAKLLVVR